MLTRCTTIGRHLTIVHAECVRYAPRRCRQAPTFPACHPPGTTWSHEIEPSAKTVEFKGAGTIMWLLFTEQGAFLDGRDIPA